MKKASITPFCAICFMLVTSVVFVLLELARVYGLDYYASLRAEAMMDSLCAEYQPLLWEQYGLLVLDGAYGTEYFSEAYMTERLEELDFMQQIKEDNLLGQKGIDLFYLPMIEAEQEGYALVTDEQGQLFLKYIAERMKEELPIGIAENIYERYQMNDIVQADDFDYVITEAEETLQWAERSRWNDIEEMIEDAETEEEEQKARSERWVFWSSEVINLENVFGTISKLKASGTFEMLLGEGFTVSDKKSKPETYIVERNKQEGTIQYTEKENWYQKVLVLEYLDKYFSCYGEKKDGHYLDYELEYILVGKDMEWKNLEAIAQKLLLIREAANITYILKSAEKMQQAEGLASAIALLIGENPAVIEVVKMGVIASWAYAESILDVRTLMSGGIIPIIKNEEDWTLDILDLFCAFQVNTKAKECESGMNYKEYLKLLLIMENDTTLSYRMMEVMEISLHEIQDYKNCKMNHMYLAFQYKLHFESKPLFFSFITIGNASEEKFHFWKQELRSYIP